MKGEIMIDNILRRTACTLLTLLLAASVAADSHHPKLSESLVISLDVSAIERNARSSTPFELAFGDTRLNVVLSPAPLWPKEGLTVTEVQRDGKVTERVVQGNFTYAGDVVGEDPKESEARFTIAGGVLEGYVLSPSAWWFFEPYSRFDPKARADQYLVYDAAHHFTGTVDLGEDGVKTDTVFDPTRRDTQIPLLMVADLEYMNENGFNFEWFLAQTALINNVNGIVFDQLHVDFKVRRALGDGGGLFITSTNAFSLLHQLEDFVGQAGGLEDRFESHLAHLTTAKNLDGFVRTLGWQPGFYGLSKQRKDDIDVGPVFLAFENMVVAAHVLGHNFNGAHWEAHRVCNPICRATIMWPVLELINNPKFSDGTLDPNHNNKKRVCENMVSRGFSFACQ
jgi:hypothetical protein